MGIVAFAAEPTTSTEADIHEGRAHGAFFHAGSTASRVMHVAQPSDDLVPSVPVALATLLALLVLASSGSIAVAPAAGRDGSVLRWATTARRGPPARV